MEIDEEKYNKFISALAIGDIAVLRSQSVRSVPILPGDSTDVSVEFEVMGYEADEEVKEFTAFTRTAAAFGNDDEPFAEVEVVHSIDYQSSVPITDDLFAVFSDANLQFHVWPFARQFLHNAVQQFGWNPLVLPPFVPDDEDES